MIFAEDVMTESGSKVVGQWQEVTEAFIERLNQLNPKLRIKEPIKVVLPRK